MMNKSIFVFLLSIVPTTYLGAQELEFTEWEKQTFLKQPPEKIMDVAGIRSGMIVGEVGAGYGRVTLNLANRVGPTGKVYANDISEEALDSLTRRCKNAGLTNVEIILGQEDNPLFRKGSLDIAIMVWTYHWFDNPVPFLENLPWQKTGISLRIKKCIRFICKRA